MTFLHPDQMNNGDVQVSSSKKSSYHPTSRDDALVSSNLLRAVKSRGIGKLLHLACLKIEIIV